jgi:hypothetical protein
MYIKYTLTKMTTPKRVFRIHTDELLILMNAYKITDIQTSNSTSAMIGQYLKKSFKTGTFEITRIGLLREATWARKNGLIEWCEIVSNWAEMAEVPVQPSGLI